MARLLEEQPILVVEDDAEERTGTGRTTARALATALALLMISLLVVTRSQDAFDTNPATTDASFTTGDVRLTDDDDGTTLFDIPNMVPGRPARDCIAVTYEGDVLPVDVKLDASADGALVDALLVRIESGTGGGFQDCGGFEPDGTLFDGTLEDLAAADAMAAFTAEETPSARTFRYTFDLDPEVPVEGRASASADLAWTADS
jgi:hypothetical protein